LWLTMAEPKWPNVHYPKIDFQAIKYYSAPKKKKQVDSLDDIDPELRDTFERLGISLNEQKRLSGVAIAVDAVMDSESVFTTFKESLKEKGIIFCSISEAIREHPELVKKILRVGCSTKGQLLCSIEFSCILRWLVCLHSERRSLPDGAFHLFPH